MLDQALHTNLTYLQFVLAAITALSLVFITAPYGRHERKGWGPTIPNRWGWVLMESPAVLAFLAFFALGENRTEVVPLVLLGLWQFHYIQRTFIFPFLLRTSGKRMPVFVAMMGFTFNLLNAYINATWLSHFGAYTMAWLTDPRFIIGVVVFGAGFYINRKADRMLMNLREPGESGYKIPRGWLYERISCPNYFGEIVEWIGFAIATWSLPGLAFAAYTAANVAPRAFQHHRWYKETFDDYPKQRKALIPFVA